MAEVSPQTVLDAVDVDLPSAPADEVSPLSGLLLEAIARTDKDANAPAAAPQASGALDRFVRCEETGHALLYWFGRSELLRIGANRRALRSALEQAIAWLDDLLSDQVNAILHAPEFQRLEASWRGLAYLVEQARGVEQVKVRIFNATWRAVANDLRRAHEFDQSELFQRIYGDEYDMPGGEPYAVLLGDYALEFGPKRGYDIDDVGALEEMSKIAAASFSPFLTSIGPGFLELESLSELEAPIDFSATFRSAKFDRWRALREKEDSRFLGLLLPRMLMREPYQDDTYRIDEFRFREAIDGDPERYLWGNPVYAMGGVLIRAFDQSRWLANIQGVTRGEDTGGIVTGLPVQSHGSDQVGVALKSSTEVLITDRQEKDLTELGFVPLCHCKGTPWSAFYSVPSIQTPKRYDRDVANANARLSASLQNMFCVSRFAHYIKVIGRDKVGSFIDPSEAEDFLRRWLLQYSTESTDLTPDQKARYPLRNSEIPVQVRDNPLNPGTFYCEIHLQPHYQLDHVVNEVRLMTELAPKRM